MYETKKKKTHLRDFLHEICFGPVVICVLPLPLLQQKQHKKFLKLRHNLNNITDRTCRKFFKPFKCKYSNLKFVQLWFLSFLGWICLRYPVMRPIG